jgi:zinc transporter ZupT
MFTLSNSYIWLPLTLGILASANIALGGFLVFKFKKYFNIFLGFSGGVMIATVTFEVLPEIIEILGRASSETLTLISMSFVVLGIILFHFLSKILPLHEHGHHIDHDDHSHAHEHFGANTRLGIYGALIMIVHSFIDGLGIGVGFALSASVGLTIALAVMSHNISDGVNTVSTLIKNKVSNTKFKIILGLNIAAPLLGVLTSFFLSINEIFVLAYLSFFSGSILYLAISDILPHAHSHVNDKKPLMATLVGILFLFTLTILFHHH